MPGVEQLLADMKYAGTKGAAVFGVCRLIESTPALEGGPKGHNWFMLSTFEARPASSENQGATDEYGQPVAVAYLEVFPGQDHSERWGAPVVEFSGVDKALDDRVEGGEMSLHLAGVEGELSLLWEVSDLELLDATKSHELRTMLDQRPMLLDPSDTEEHGIPLELLPKGAAMVLLRDELQRAAETGQWVTFEGWANTGEGDYAVATQYTIAPMGTGVIVAPADSDVQEVRALNGLYADGELLTIASSDGQNQTYDVVTVQNLRVLTEDETPELY